MPSRTNNRKEFHMSLKKILAITLSIAGTLIVLPTCAQAASTGGISPNVC